MHFSFRYYGGHYGGALNSRSPNGTTPLMMAAQAENLRYAAAELERANLCLLIEPINFYDIPGFFFFKYDAT